MPNEVTHRPPVGCRKLQQDVVTKNIQRSVWSTTYTLTLRYIRSSVLRVFVCLGFFTVNTRILTHSHLDSNRAPMLSTMN